MSKHKAKGLSITTTIEERESWYALPPTRYEPKPMSAAQTSAMAFTCDAEAKRDNGYEPVPIEVLREDASILRLLDMLETCRPGQTDDEERFIETYLTQHEPFRDDYGNHIIMIEPPEGHPRILWSIHTDTVHRHGGLQKVEVTSGIAWTSTGSCLGSDDTVGIWLALQMIEAKVPGTYVFHRDEESGGGGSMWLAREAKDFLSNHDAAIALDRANYEDVITYQAGGRCCSDEFAKSVAALLGGNFKPCDRGVFTDTANYVDIIGECTNLSVGYFRQHGPMEHTNLGFAYRLRDALIAADWSQIVLKREPGEVEAGYGRYFAWDDDDRYGDVRGNGKGAPAYGSQTAALDAMEEYVQEFPWVVAEYLLELGVTIEDLDLYTPGDLTVGGAKL